jgi:hypothetical protein
MPKNHPNQSPLHLQLHKTYTKRRKTIASFANPAVPPVKLTYRHCWTP